jgi:hypothetical protein
MKQEYTKCLDGWIPLMVKVEIISITNFWLHSKFKPLKIIRGKRRKPLSEKYAMSIGYTTVLNEQTQKYTNKQLVCFLIVSWN